MDVHGLNGTVRELMTTVKPSDIWSDQWFISIEPAGSEVMQKCSIPYSTLSWPGFWPSAARMDGRLHRWRKTTFCLLV